MTDENTLLDETHMMLGLQPLNALKERFSSTEELVEFLEDGGDLTEIHGVGRTTNMKIVNWLKEEYPRAHRQHLKKTRPREYQYEYHQSK